LARSGFAVAFFYFLGNELVGCGLGGGITVEAFRLDLTGCSGTAIGDGEAVALQFNVPKLVRFAIAKSKFAFHHSRPSFGVRPVFTIVFIFTSEICDGIFERKFGYAPQNLVQVGNTDLQVVELLKKP